ncbi:MAG: tRNA (adenosine(37)-N6)-threonylcarbamoyltransferase complex ATPase subunit type 1 TsaE [Desulfovibrio sp.]|nr:tRNA (adenosine(37)-N6)-threonylcarbamoyltransferase complex ATPase subunit type 1 TsaE [Desulfovibrio sp.]
MPKPPWAKSQISADQAQSRQTFQHLDQDEIEILGALLAQEVSRLRLRTLLFFGPLGSGKTTLIRALVSSLPGSAQAQVSSPSFALCNYYPVEPPVIHADLYRCQEEIPEELLEALEEGEQVLLIEWAEFLPNDLLPTEVLSLELELAEAKRNVSLSAKGKLATLALESLTQDFKKRINQSLE